MNWLKPNERVQLKQACQALRVNRLPDIVSAYLFEEWQNGPGDPLALRERQRALDWLLALLDSLA